MTGQVPAAQHVLIEHDPLLLQRKQPVRFTFKESIVWYRLVQAQGKTVRHAELLYLGWGPLYNWNDPDPYVRDLNRGVLYTAVKIMNRLLEAHGHGYHIVNEHRMGYRLVSTE
jgi:DNA-binding winged helix-turn-helix (wHTH) protein